MECGRTTGQRVMPVFYDVDPLYVRNQRGEFGEAFEDLMERISEDKVKVWGEVLQDSTNISGFDLHNSRDEIEDIIQIVENINCLLDNRVLFVAQHPIGVHSRVQEVTAILNQLRSKGFLKLGIWGMGGLGKTTIAKAIYNQIHKDFEGCCFLPDVVVRHHSLGLVHLQERILSDIYKTMKIRIHDIESGMYILKRRLSHKRILLILDGVSYLDQLDALCYPEWFGRGSTIIITTRDKQLLKAFEVDHIYELPSMNIDESVELLSWHAFEQASPKEDFVELSSCVVGYCHGIPLALEIIGSLLFDKEVEEWRIVLEKFKRHPDHAIHQVLLTSVDGLSKTEKIIFLEIACFFIGMDLNEVIQILNGYGLLAKNGISVLTDRRLVKVDNKSRLGMPGLLQEVGRSIKRQEHEPKIYDVFLSFRGEDTRASFTSHLYASLQNAGIYVFRDDDEIQRGDKVSSSLMEAIGKSRIAVVVLSRNYANSKWCMQELEKIMDSRSPVGLVVVPVFYNVDPSEVRHQTGMFGQAFEDIMEGMNVTKVKKQTWRDMLLKVGEIAGFVVQESRNENEDIMKIVEHVTRLLDWKDLFVANHPVAVESRVQDVLKLLKNQQSTNALLLGIWGIGGIGKTTIAKAIYNKIHRKFEGRCFLLNIREIWEQDNGGVRLQEQLLFDIYKTMKVKIENIEFGKSILEKRLGQKRILLVLDDVNELEQLNALAGSHKWFRLGSIIIITTRDNHLLDLLSVNELYSMEEMNDKESVELFSWHAFKEPCPTEEFAGLSSEVISYCGRLPLALEVLGSHLFKRDIIEWKSVLEKLKSIPDKKVEKKLKISFDGLNDDKEKEIFLDIAFFFIGMERNDVIDILNSCGHSTEIGMKVLIEQSLLTVDTKNKLRMHDLLRDIGKEVIRERSPNMPEERSRLWDSQEVCDILSKEMGTKAVQGLALKLPIRMNPFCFKTRAFKYMKRLKLLQLAGVELDGDFKHLSTDLRWLCWHGFLSPYTPANFDQRNLAAIDLKYSNLQLVWKKGQFLDKLKILNLSHSQHLTHTPNFSYLPSLEKLILKDCPSLSSVSHTIGHLKQILLINLKGCTSLRALPRSIYKLKSLKTLILSGCSKIDKLEEDLEQMESLTTLMANNTAIRQVPYAVLRSKSIGYISLCGFEGLSRHVFPSIIWSWTSPTNNLSPQMQTSDDRSCFVSLTVPNSSFPGKSSIMRELPKVQSFRLECGSHIQTTRDVALDTINVKNCKELEATPTTSHVSNMNASALVDCCSQGDVSGAKKFLNSFLIQMGMKCHVTEVLRETILKTGGSVPGDCLLPGDKNPDWLTFNSEGFSVSFEVPQVNGRNLKTMMLCIVYSSSPDIITSGVLILKNVLIINYTKAITHVYDGDKLTSLKDKDWQSVISNLELDDKVQVVVAVGSGSIVKKIAVYLIYEEPIDQNMEHCRADVFVDTVSGGDDVVADMNENASSVDVANENVEDMVADMNENTSSVDRVAADGNAIVSDMPADNNNDIVSGGDENRFGRFFKLPSLVRAILKTRPFWFGLLVILVWITGRHSNKRRKFNLISRYTLGWKWLVEHINKRIAYRRANKAQGAIECSSRVL